jgi:hypothetical protein
MEILKAMLRLRTSEFIFPGTKAGQPLLVMALEMVLRRADVDATVHSFGAPSAIGQVSAPHLRESLPKRRLLICWGIR